MKISEDNYNFVKDLIIKFNEMEDIKKIKTFAKGGGKETFFRVTLRNQIRIVAIIDSKASTIISVSTLIVTLVIAMLGGNFAYAGAESLQNYSEELPFFVLLIFELAAIFFALISTQYELMLDKKTVMGSPMQFTLLKDKKIDLSFYMNRMEEILTSNEELYKTLSVDVFFMRKVILGKRKYLNIAYATFFLGFLGAIGLLIWLYL